MAILSEYEEDQNPTKSSSSGKPFNAVFDSSKPLEFLETVFEFVSRESDLFKRDSVVRDVNALVRMVKERVDADERKAKEKAGDNGKAEKKHAKEAAQPSASTSVQEEKKEEPAKDDKNADGKRGSVIE